MRDEELKVVMQRNNQNNEQVGHYTGRCMKCGSKDLWDDMTAYGCNACDATYMVGDLPPLIILNGRQNASEK